MLGDHLINVKGRNVNVSDGRSIKYGQNNKNRKIEDGESPEG